MEFNEDIVMAVMQVGEASTIAASSGVGTVILMWQGAPSEPRLTCGLVVPSKNHTWGGTPPRRIGAMEDDISPR